MTPRSTSDRVVIAHLFPEQLNLYGDRGNVETLVRRATWRGIEAVVRPIGPDDGAALTGADIVFIGGGQDRQQADIARHVRELAEPLARVLSTGAALLAVCAGYQLLGRVYRSPLVGEIAGAGILDVETDVPPGAERLTGAVVIDLGAGSAVTSAIASASPSRRPTRLQRVVGFENHSGRTTLAPGGRPLGRVMSSAGLAGPAREEGLVELPGEGRFPGLRIGTYLHGPLLPRNPHLADLILGSGLAHGAPQALPTLPDLDEWRAHDAFESDWRLAQPGPWRQSRLGQALDRLAARAGF